jgi:hypothetical protein
LQNNGWAGDVRNMDGEFALDGKSFDLVLPISQVHYNLSVLCPPMQKTDSWLVQFTLLRKKCTGYYKLYIVSYSLTTKTILGT